MARERWEYYQGGTGPVLKGDLGLVDVVLFGTDPADTPYGPTLALDVRVEHVRLPTTGAVSRLAFSVERRDGSWWARSYNRLGTVIEAVSSGSADVRKPLQGRGVAQRRLGDYDVVTFGDDNRERVTFFLPGHVGDAAFDDDDDAAGRSVDVTAPFTEVEKLVLHALAVPRRMHPEQRSPAPMNQNDIAAMVKAVGTRKVSNRDVSEAFRSIYEKVNGADGVDPNGKRGHYMSAVFAWVMAEAKDLPWFDAGLVEQLYRAHREIASDSDTSEAPA